MITDAQIEQLRTEAAEAGDLVQVALCEIALERCTGHESYLDALRDSAHAEVSDPAEARALCAEAIAMAEAAE